MIKKFKFGDLIVFQEHCHEIVHHYERGVHSERLILVDCGQDEKKCTHERCCRKEDK